MQNKTVLFDKFGAAVELYVKEIPLPPINDNELLIKTAAAALNPIDAKIRNGSSFVCKNRKDPFPWTLGFDFAGTIENEGRNNEFKAGDKVYINPMKLLPLSRFTEYFESLPSLSPEPRSLLVVRVDRAEAVAEALVVVVAVPSVVAEAAEARLEAVAAVAEVRSVAIAEVAAVRSAAVDSSLFLFNE